MQMANHLSPDKRTEKLMAEQVFGNNEAELQGHAVWNRLAVLAVKPKEGGHSAAIVEFSEDAILSMNLDGIMQSWNAGAQRLYGFTEAEVLGKPITIRH